MAGNATINDEDDAIAAINIIPFVDIVLVLLVIFMLTSTAIVRAGLKVDLPKAASAASTVPSTLNIVVTKDDVIYLNGELKDRRELAAIVRERAAVDPTLQAVVAADRLSAYGRVIAVIDLIKQNGVKSFALNLERDVADNATPL